MTATRSRESWRLAAKSTQDLLDRLRYLEGRATKAEARIHRWMNERVSCEERIADVHVALRARGIVTTEAR